MTIAQEKVMPTDRTFTGYLERGEPFALYHAGARFYSGALGRFLSPDPLAAAAGDPRALNPYAYAANNPLRYTDPSGLYPVDAAGNWAVAPGAYVPPSLMAAVVFVPAAPLAAPAVVAAAAAQLAAAGGTAIVLCVVVCEETIGLTPPVVGDVDLLPCLYHCDAPGFIGTGGSQPYFGQDAGEYTLFSDGADAPPEAPNLEDGVPAGWEWVGSGPEGSESGQWINPDHPRENIHPHPDSPSHGPHVDYRARDGSKWRWSSGDGWSRK